MTQRQTGYTLVEIMIVVALVAIISAIAIPAYQGYGLEARLNAARQNMGPLRLALEDYALDNSGEYGPAGTKNQAAIASYLGWSPSGDEGKYTYQVVVTNTSSTDSYDILVTHTSSGDWVLCQDKMNTCCDSTVSGASTSACP